MNPIWRHMVIVLAVAVSSVPAYAQTYDKDKAPLSGLPAFPGAEGFGALVTGGRGGEVYHVTNLNDSGPGSFRDAVGRGSRIVVFDVGGYIDLRSIVSVRSNITIAGQTAPGDGIATKNYEVSFSGSRNVIVRYMRFRQGLTPGQNRKPAVNIYQGRDIILDHVSLEWGRWDTISINGSSNITVQNSIIGEGIDPQRFGCLCQSDNLTLSHNLWISNKSRNPKSKGKTQFINNVVYNWGTDAYIEGNSSGRNDHDIVGNYFIKGPSTGGRATPFSGGNANAHVYATGNYFDDNRNGRLDGRETTEADLGPVTIERTPLAEPPVPVAVDAAQDAYANVVESVGASLVRDAVDTRLIDDVASLGTSGQLIYDPAEVGGFGTLNGGPAPIDSDGDGMPDEWEIYYGLNPYDPSDRNGDFDGTGYTNIEKYINGLADGSYPFSNDE